MSKGVTLLIILKLYILQNTHEQQPPNNTQNSTVLHMLNSVEWRPHEWNGYYSHGNDGV